MNKMIITRLMLVNYKRFLNGITKFVFTPDESTMLQLILGTNGSGKSSLLYELWPLPGLPDDFGVNGIKELCIDYNGREYQLISTFEGKPSHQFIMNGTDLNDGGKIEMFRALAEEHFGVTNELRSLALEKEVLSTMSPSRRRYWFVKLADTDFNYAIRVYNALKDAHRDAQGMIKRLNKRLVDETAKLVEKSVVDEMTAETKEIKLLINEIYDMRNAQARRVDEVLADVEELDSLLNQNCLEIDRFNVSSIEASGYSSREEVVERRDAVKLEIHGVQQISQHLFTDHSRIKKKYDLLIKAGTESITELEEKKSKALDTIAFEEMYISMKNVAITSDPQQLKDALVSMYQDLIDRLTALKPNDGYYSRSKVNEYEERVNDLIAQYSPLQARISRLNEDIEHRRDHVKQDSIVCPSCSHSWTLKASENDLKKADEMLLQLKEAANKINEEIKEKNAYIKEYGEYAVSYRSVAMTMKSAPILANYFNEITQNNRLALYPGSVSSDLYTALSDLEHHIEIDKNRKLIAHLTEQIDLKKNLDADTIENIEKDLRHIELTMNTQTQLLNSLQSELNMTETLIRQYDAINKLNTQLLNNTEMRSKHAKEYLYSRYQELLWQLIMALQTNLARKEDALAQINSQQQIVDEIIKQSTEAEMNERIAKAAHIALSPTNGAIAEGLQKSVGAFLMKMNRVINSIWSYPLELQPFSMADGNTEMDYKFPFIRNKEGKPYKDIVEGSESMIDIFNFAFRLCALRQLGLEHLPLFLDEFESAYDDTHREKAVYFVKKLLDEQAYGQIFMVSHYESNHGALSNLAQTCVLSKDNLMLPTNIVFNEHVLLS